MKVWNELETRRRDALKRETLLEEQSQTVETDRAMLSAVEAKLSEREQTLLVR